MQSTLQPVKRSCAGCAIELWREEEERDLEGKVTTPKVSVLRVGVRNRSDAFKRGRFVFTQAKDLAPEVY